MRLCLVPILEVVEQCRVRSWRGFESSERGRCCGEVGDATLEQERQTSLGVPEMQVCQYARGKQE